MRVEPHGEGSILHIVKRGARGGLIARDERDREHFLRCLFYLNDEHQDRNWTTSLKGTPFPERPIQWPVREPLVDVLAWTLMPNHFHLILRERKEKGIARFMQRVGGSMSLRINTRYGESGSLFQGSYRGRVVDGEGDLRWLASYVMVKNTLELYQGGLAKAIRNFEDAWNWALGYPFSSLGIYATNKESPIINATENPLIETCSNLKKFKRDSQDMLNAFIEKKVNLKDRKPLMLE